MRRSLETVPFASLPAHERSEDIEDGGVEPDTETRGSEGICRELRGGAETAA